MKKLLPAFAAIVVMIALAADGATAQKKDKNKDKEKAAGKQQSGNQARTPNQQANRSQQSGGNPSTGRNQPSSGNRSAGGNPPTRTPPPEQVTIVPPSSGEQDGARTGNEGKQANNPAATSQNNAAAQTASASSLSDPLILGIAALLLLAGFALHGIHFISTNRLKNDSGRINYNLNALHARIEEMSVQVSELRRSRNQSSKAPDQENSDPDKFQRLEDRIRETRSHLEEAAQAIAALTSWAGESAIERALRSSDGLSDAQRAQAVNAIEPHLDQVIALAARLGPLAQEMVAFEERIKQRPWLPAELSSRVRGLNQEIRQFEDLKARAGNQIASLRRGSISERHKQFIEEKNRLLGQLNAREISVTDYVKGCRQLTKSLFAEPSVEKQIPVAEMSDRLASLASDAPDILMDWYDDLFQLHFQIAASQSVDSETAEEIARIRRMAKEALLKFDIQPEEIQPGRTSYDHRLHGEAIVTQSSQYPANIVVSVQQCGFRRVSNAEVLRRPKVVVAGVGAG